MKHLKGLMIAALGASVFMAACGNDDHTASYPAYQSTVSTTTDTVMNNSPMAATPDTTSTTPNTGVASTETTSPATKSPVVKKKSKITVGTMPVSKNSKVEMDKAGVYEFSEIRPSYNGGQDALETYINNHTEYPQQAIDNNTQGTVDVQFTVDENGKISNAHVLGKGLGDGLNEEAVRVVSDLPKWTPGQVRGKTVKSKMVLPITFKIEDQ